MTRRPILWLPALLFLGLAIRGQAAWTPAPQPQLKQLLRAAPELTVEDLGVPVTSTRVGDTMLVPNPDGKSYDVLQWYYQDYSGPTSVMLIDLATSEVHRQEIPLGRQIHECGRVLGPDGRFYLTTPDQYAPERQKGMELYVYDPADNHLTNRGVIVRDLGGEARPMVVGTDGMIYGAGSYDASRRSGIYQLDPDTGKVTDYGPVGPSHAPAGCWSKTLGADDEYVYVASGRVPWYLIAYEKETGDAKVLLETDRALGDLAVLQRHDGCVAHATHVKGEREETVEYWLYRGKAIRKTDDTPPWPARPEREDLPTPPQLYTAALDPDARGWAQLWYRKPGSDASARKGASVSEKRDIRDWNVVEFKVDLFPMDLRLLTELPDGRLFGTADFYLGNFLFDPETRKVERPGKLALSHYCTAMSGSKLYLSGYPFGDVYTYDLARPWTVGRAGLGDQPIDVENPASNPRLRTHLIDASRASKMFAAAVGSDGKVYFGGQAMRDANGGGLGWWDPKVQQAGGLWEPFTAFAIHHLAPVDGGKYLVASTEVVRDDLRNNFVPKQAKLFVYNVPQGKVVRTLEPVPGADSTGPIVEAMPGLLLGATADPQSGNGTVLYGVDVRKGEVRFVKHLPAALGVDLTYGHSDFRKGPDGRIWTYLDDVLVRINPSNVAVEVLGQAGEPGRIAFAGEDIYLAGTPHLRRIRGLLNP